MAMFHRFSLLALLVASMSIVAPVRGDDDAKMKEDKKEGKKEEKKEKEWSTLYTVSNEPGGFKHFDVGENSKVKFSWVTAPDGGVPQFRVTVAKLNPRNGSYQIIGTIVSTNTAAKSSSGMVLAAGKYRLYVATKFMKYTLTVEGQPLK